MKRCYNCGYLLDNGDWWQVSEFEVACDKCHKRTPEPTVTIKVEPWIPKIEHPDQLEKLECGYCRKPIGWMYENDLNGSYFYCFDCVKKHGK